MSWYIHHCGERTNRSYAQIFEHPYPVRKPDVYGPYRTKEEAEKEAKRRGFSLTSLRDLTK